MFLGKKKCAHKSLTLLLALVAGVFLLCQGQAVAQQGPDKIKAQKEYNKELDKTARTIARVLKNKRFREFLSQEIQASENWEQILAAEEFLTKAKGQPDFPPGILNALESLAGVKSKMKGPCKTTTVDLYFPVDVHREEWRGEEDLLIAFVPAEDESQVTEILAYSVITGELVSLDAAEAPETPTLVISARERKDLQRRPPVSVVAEPPEETSASEVGEIPHDGNSYIGIPYVKILDDQEPWYRGDPEIFVLIGQSYKTTGFEHVIHLRGVNSEDKWYYIGDGPGYPLFFYFDSNYSDLTYFDFWEEDTGWDFKVSASVEYGGVNVGLSWVINDGDDHLGKRYINKSEIPWSGHHTRTTADVSFKVDKDP
jgi:hypothetical protein